MGFYLPLQRDSVRILLLTIMDRQEGGVKQGLYGFVVYRRRGSHGKPGIIGGAVFLVHKVGFDAVAAKGNRKAAAKRNWSVLRKA